MNAFTLFLTLAVSTGVVLFLLKLQRTKQLAYIDDYKFHRSLRDKLAAKHPTLNDEQVDLVLQALKDYFWMCNKGKRKMVAMPSQVVDDAWHEFILFTRSYKQFCDKALGRFLHHTPTEAMSSPTVAQEGIRRAWRLACAKAEINPRTPDRLPLIFGSMHCSTSPTASPTCSTAKTAIRRPMAAAIVPVTSPVPVGVPVGVPGIRADHRAVAMAVRAAVAVAVVAIELHSPIAPRLSMLDVNPCSKPSVQHE